MDRERLHSINAEQLVTRTDRVLHGFLAKRRPSRPAMMHIPVDETTLFVRPLAAPPARPPWRAVVFGAMAGVLVGAIAITQLARSAPASVAHAQVQP